MQLSPAGKEAKLNALAEIEGYPVLDQLLEAAVLDGASPRICVAIGCDDTTEIEPDQDKGWYDNSGRGNVASVLVPAGIV